MISLLPKSLIPSVILNFNRIVLCIFSFSVYSLVSFWESVQFSHSVMSYSLQAHGLQHARLPCSSSTPRACSNSCPSSRWCHPTISSSVVPFFSCLQTFPASGSFPMSQFLASSGQSTGVSASASVLPISCSYNWIYRLYFNKKHQYIVIIIRGQLLFFYNCKYNLRQLLHQFFNFYKLLYGPKFYMKMVLNKCLLYKLKKIIIVLFD